MKQSHWELFTSYFLSNHYWKLMSISRYLTLFYSTIEMYGLFFIKINLCADLEYSLVDCKLSLASSLILLLKDSAPSLASRRLPWCLKTICKFCWDSLRFWSRRLSINQLLMICLMKITFRTSSSTRRSLACMCRYSTGSIVLHHYFPLGQSHWPSQFYQNYSKCMIIYLSHTSWRLMQAVNPK